jgi:hypothetical protein
MSGDISKLHSDLGIAKIIQALKAGGDYDRIKDSMRNAIWSQLEGAQTPVEAMELTRQLKTLSNFFGQIELIAESKQKEIGI